MPKNRGPRQKCYVPLGNFKYGWLINSDKLKNIAKDFGIIKVISTSWGITYGANSPKPGTCTKKLNTGNLSSFYDPKKEKTLKQNNNLYSLKATPKNKRIKLSGKAVTVYVTTPLGYKYAWNMISGDVDLALKAGVVKASAGETDLVWGSFPKPPRAYIQTDAGGFSTFCPPTDAGVENAVKNGFTVEGIDPDWSKN